MIPVDRSMRRRPVRVSEPCGHVSPRPRLATAGSRGRAGRARWAVERHGAFTLVEILLVIALIGLFSTLFVVNFESLMKQSESEAVESAFWLAVREARTRALVERRAQSLSFDAKAMAFRVEEPGASPGLTFSIDRSNWQQGTKVELALQKRLEASQFSLVGGRLVERREVALVQFFPDGTCTPFLVAMKVGRTERTIEIDPWTGAELLGSDDA